MIIWMNHLASLYLNFYLYDYKFNINYSFHLFLSLSLSDKSIRQKRRIRLISRSGEKNKTPRILYTQHTVCLREEMSSRYAWVSYVSKLWRPSVARLKNDIRYIMISPSVIPCFYQLEQHLAIEIFRPLKQWRRKRWVNIERKK